MRGARLAVALAILTVVLSAIPRLALTAGVLPDPLRGFVWSDVVATYVARLSGGRLPYFGGFFEYPPLVGYLAGIFVSFSPGPLAYVAAWALVSLVAAAFVALVLVRAVGPLRTTLFWSLSPQLLLYGAANFDVLAIALLIWALALSRAGRSRLAMAVLAAGAMVKAFPALAAPFEILRVRRSAGTRSAVTVAAIFMIAAFLIALPSLIAPHPITDSAAYVAGLTNFDSVWGLVLAALRVMGVPAAASVIAVVSAVGLAVTYWRVIRGRSHDLARATLLGLVAVLLWTRLYSPQYSLWIVPFFALLPLGTRLFALLSLADVVVFATVYPLTLVSWPEGDPRATLLFGALTAGVILRHVALVMIWRAGWTASPRPSPTSSP